MKTFSRQRKGGKPAVDLVSIRDNQWPGSQSSSQDSPSPAAISSRAAFEDPYAFGLGEEQEDGKAGAAPARVRLSRQRSTPPTSIEGTPDKSLLVLPTEKRLNAIKLTGASISSRCQQVTSAAYMQLLAIARV
jgi:hypothetical protein